MNTPLDSDHRNALQEKIIEEARDWGYFQGSIKSLTDLWQGKKILDIGMGGGPHSVSYAAKGCKSYIGVDPLVGSDEVRDFRNPKVPGIPAYHAFPYSTEEIMEAFPNVHLYSGLIEDVTDKLEQHSPDFALMAAVTEHLQDLPRVFESIWNSLEKGGILWFSHCNYYSWTGHHRYPREVESWDYTNGQHNSVVNWKHLEVDHECYNNPNFNRVRLQDLYDLTNKYFEIADWRVSPFGMALLSRDIRKKYKKYTLEELLGRNIYVTAIRRDEPLNLDLSQREFFHPSEEYLADVDHSSENSGPFHVLNSVYFNKNNELCSHSDNNVAGLRVIECLRPGDKISLKKYWHRFEFTVKEVLRPKRATSRLTVIEPLPTEIKNGRVQWSLSRMENVPPKDSILSDLWSRIWN